MSRQAEGEVREESCAYDIENQLIEKLVELSWEKMSEAERREALRTVDVNAWPGGSADHRDDPQQGPRLGCPRSRSRRVLRSPRLEQYWSCWRRRVCGSARRWRCGRPLALVALAVPMITGAAYRVTVPAVIQIAMRRKYGQKDRF